MIRASRASRTWTDWNVGRVLDELDEQGLREKTIIAFWGDHGYHLGEKGKWSKHGSLFEVGMRVPLLVVAPGAKGDGKMSMQNRFPGDAGKAWNAAPKTNLLRLERKGGAYRVKINDQDVGSLPDTVAPGELTAVKLGMSLKNKDDKTPRIYAVRVVPLDEPAKPE